MKLSFTLLFITLTTFSGGLHSEVEQAPAKQPEIIVKAELPIDKKTDSLKIIYYTAIDYRNISFNKLIEEKKIVDKENMQLHAEIKRLKKANNFLRNNIDTVYIRYTVFKKRKILQLFKN